MAKIMKGRSNCVMNFFSVYKYSIVYVNIKRNFVCKENREY